MAAVEPKAILLMVFGTMLAYFRAARIVSESGLNRTNPPASPVTSTEDWPGAETFHPVRIASLRRSTMCFSISSG